MLCRPTLTKRLGIMAQQSPAAANDQNSNQSVDVAEAIALMADLGDDTAEDEERKDGADAEGDGDDDVAAAEGRGFGRGRRAPGILERRRQGGLEGRSAR